MGGVSIPLRTLFPFLSAERNRCEQNEKEPPDFSGGFLLFRFNTGKITKFSGVEKILTYFNN